MFGDVTGNSVLLCGISAGAVTYRCRWCARMSDHAEFGDGIHKNNDQPAAILERLRRIARQIMGSGHRPHHSGGVGN